MKTYEFTTDNPAEIIKVGGYDGVVKVETYYHGKIMTVEHYTKSTAREFSNVLNQAAADAGFVDE